MDLARVPTLERLEGVYSWDLGASMERERPFATQGEPFDSQGEPVSSDQRSGGGKGLESCCSHRTR